MNTYPEMNAQIVGLLRISDNPVDLYAAQYIEELQKKITVCRDCKYSHMTYDGMCKYYDKWMEQGIDEALYLSGDFFCKFGDLKEAEEEL